MFYIAKSLKKIQCINHTTWAIIGFVVMGLAIPMSSVMAQQDTEGQNDLISVPAQFLRLITLPGNSDHFLRPGNLIYDRSAGELLVADPGNSRIVIFDSLGVYLFEFSLTGYCGSIADYVVSSSGRIVVLGTTTEGRELLSFDFDGTYLGLVQIPTNVSLDLYNVSSIGIDADDRLYLLDKQGFRIVRVGTSDDDHLSIAIRTELNQAERLEVTLGTLTVSNGSIYLPVPSAGTVHRYSTDGEYLGSIGHRGTTTASMSFPVAVAVTDDQLVLVVDKQRFNVQCYTIEGDFLGEFGGKGLNLGWFYFPSRIAVDSRGTIYVGQIFKNRVQACKLPDVIYDRFRETAAASSVSDSAPSAYTDEEHLSKRLINAKRAGTTDSPDPRIISYYLTEVYYA